MKIVSTASLVQNKGAKLLVYGPPGTAKTPLIATAPKPLLVAIEAGLLSMRGSNVPAVDATTAPALDDFLKWLSSSSEVSKFETIAIDSITEFCEVILQRSLKKNSHGLKAYGEMATYMRGALKLLNACKPHVYMTAKLDLRKEGEMSVRAPLIPGQDFKFTLPHDVDEVFFVNRFSNEATNYKPILCFQTGGSPDTIARDRSGKLAFYEKPDLGYIFEKITKG